MTQSIPTKPAPRHYLWHLGFGSYTGGDAPVALENIQDLWNEVKVKAKDEPPVKVAIIDTGIDVEHPNLVCAMDGDQIDFGPARYGAIYDPRETPLRDLRELFLRKEKITKDDLQKTADAIVKNRARRRGRRKPLQSLTAAIKGLNGNATELSPEQRMQLFHDLFESVDDTLATTSSEFGPLPDPSEFFGDEDRDGLTQEWMNILEDVTEPLETLEMDDPSGYFGAHGTACAGLVGGRRPKEGGPDGPIAYYGVNPYCKIVSYATPYSHEFLPVIIALIHAFASEAEVILFPRGVPRMEFLKRDACLSNHSTRITADQEEGLIQPNDLARFQILELHEAILEALLKLIAKERYLVLSAGNDGFEDEFSYPAQALRDDPNVFIVGARNSRGLRSAYTNGKESEKTLWMLSDDSVMIDVNTFSIDERSFVGSDFDYRPHLPNNNIMNTFDPWGLLTLDVRGNYGYSAGGHADPGYGDEDLETKGLYSIFGGTSAASSLIAGLISLLLQAGVIQNGRGRAKYARAVREIKKHYRLVDVVKSDP